MNAILYTCPKCGCDSPEDWWTLFINEGAYWCDPCEINRRTKLLK